MGIMDTMRTIASAMCNACCTLFKYKNNTGEDTGIKIDENIHEKEEDLDTNNQKSSDTSADTREANTILQIIIRPKNQRDKNASMCFNQFRLAECKCKQQKQNLLPNEVNSPIIFVSDKQYYGLSDLDEQKHNVLSEADIQNLTKIISKAESTLLMESLLIVASSTKNLQSNCSTDSNLTTSTSYIPYCKECQKMQDKINENRTCPLTSTEMNSKHTSKRSSFVKLRKRTAALFGHKNSNR